MISSLNNVGKEDFVVSNDRLPIGTIPILSTSSPEYQGSIEVPSIRQANKYIISKSKFQVGGSTSKFLHLVEEVILQCPLERIKLNDKF